MWPVSYTHLDVYKRQTRDVVEEMIEIKGLPVRLLDTAGIRETDDIVEQLGVERSKEMIAQSDLVLYVIDGSQDYAPEEGIVSLLQGKDCVLVQNKACLLYTSQQRAHAPHVW